jgi:hypothetical protein
MDGERFALVTGAGSGVGKWRIRSAASKARIDAATRLKNGKPGYSFGRTT